MQIIAIVVSLTIAAVGLALFVRAIRTILGVIRVGQPVARNDNPGSRTVTMLKETLGHTRMLQWTAVGVAHWFVFVGFGLLFFTLLTAFGQLFDAHFALPLIGHFFLWEWVSEFFTVVMLVAIVAFIGYRASRPRERVRGTKGRFFGSTMWQGYFVEMVILGVGLCIVTLRGLEYALLSKGGEHADNATAFHFPFSAWLGEAFSGLSTGSIENAIYLVAMLKIVISFAWMITISLTPTMGVAWHRFTAFFNIWFKRDSDGSTALGAVKPLTSAGRAVALDDIDDLDEDSPLGVGSIEDFSWKGILDFTSCTECGRCQSQCPAWNTEKPLSPKLLITALRDHAYAKAPYLQAGTEEERTALPADVLLEAERPLVGDTGDDWFYMPENGSAVIDPDVLWSCTSCGACVQQCPVDIEHVDHIIDMRRHQLLVEANFPAELNQLFKGLENKGNPWNMSPKARMDWAKDLPFEVKTVGGEAPGDPESLDEVDWLFWVGCAGAYEDRAKKTTRAVAELLDIAGVSFGVLGNGETCTGDPARRAGNEFVFQGLAQQNAETFTEYKVKKVVSTCAHCFNTLKNEYREFGVELEVVHHTQLLNRLVREGKLTPVTEGDGAAKRSITYHDPCFLGRHNQVYAPPRELLQVLPGAEVVEMERNSEKSFCCGAGGARMWMEENIGERINLNRTKEAVGTGADQIAVGCPFCRVMLSDGLTSEQANGNAREEVEVLDVAQMLLASVKGEVATRVRKPAAAPAAKAGAPAAGGDEPAEDEATKAEPESGDATQTTDTVTATEDVGPAAKASGGASLFDTPADEEPEKPEPAAAAEESSDVGAAEADEAEQAPTGGSLFDIEAPAAPSAKAQPANDEAPTAPATETDDAETEPATGDDEPTTVPEAADENESAVGSGGSLFDIKARHQEQARSESNELEAKAEPEPEPEAKTSDPGTAATPATELPDLDSGGSLFDLAAPEPAAPASATASSDEPAADAEPEAEPQAEPEPEAEPEAEVEPEAEPEPGPEPEAVPEATPKAAATPATEIPDQKSGGSLFDLTAPEPAPAAAEPQADAEPEAASQPEPEPEADAEPESEAAPEPEPDTEPEPEAESEPDEPDEPDEPEKPKASGATNEPKQADITAADSLFDL